VNRSIVVEDAPAGIEAARRAGMKSIGVSHPGGLGADIDVKALTALDVNAFDLLLTATQP
jgi:beta-phosphoglucomutase-like phosphatase (HAD superfamily)